MAHFAIRFTKKAKGHMNIFSQAVQAGKIGELEIQPSYIEVSKYTNILYYYQIFRAEVNQGAND